MSNPARIETIAEKLRSLPPEKVAEVEDFIDFLRERTDRELVDFAQRASHPALSLVWDNDDDAEYDEL